MYKMPRSQRLFQSRIQNRRRRSDMPNLHGLSSLVVNLHTPCDGNLSGLGELFLRRGLRVVHRSAGIRHVRQRHAYAPRFLLIGSGGGVAILVIVVLRVAAATIYGVAVDNGEGREGTYYYCCKEGMCVSGRFHRKTIPLWDRKLGRSRLWQDVPMQVSMIAQSASQELLGVLSLRALTPIWTTRTMAATMQMMPTAKIPPMLNFWLRGI